jgi:hypothetical protein
MKRDYAVRGYRKCPRHNREKLGLPLIYLTRGTVVYLLRHSRLAVFST